jgi:flagellar basal body-associated protein FliL
VILVGAYQEGKGGKMLFWWLIIGFTVVWIIAVVIEVIWFGGPAEESEASPGAACERTSASGVDEFPPAEGTREVTLENRAS